MTQQCVQSGKAISRVFALTLVAAAVPSLAFESSAWIEVAEGDLTLLVGICALSLSLLGAAPGPVLAGDIPKPGYYTGKDGDKTLTVTKSADGVLSFEAFAEGGNDSSCELDGEIHSGIGKVSLADYGVQDFCTFNFAQKGAKVELSGDDVCYQICPRGDVRAIYTRTNPLCIIPPT